tara:strand:+ start:225 stop:920 length:696 start_codon:yes stop_codon:yes gene_type:complete
MISLQKNSKENPIGLLSLDKFFSKDNADYFAEYLDKLGDEFIERTKENAFYKKNDTMISEFYNHWKDYFVDGYTVQFIIEKDPGSTTFHCDDMSEDCEYFDELMGLSARNEIWKLGHNNWRDGEKIYGNFKSEYVDMISKDMDYEWTKDGGDKKLGEKCKHNMRFWGRLHDTKKLFVWDNIKDETFDINFYFGVVNTQNWHSVRSDSIGISFTILGQPKDILINYIEDKIR